MKKALLIFNLLFTSFLFSQAQFNQIAKGPNFTEPEEGYAKIFQLKNGNTFYMHITLTEGINIRIYDANHAEKVVTTINPTYGGLEKGSINGVFEFKDDVVMFMNGRDDRNIGLLRLTIDGNTGKLKEETRVATTHKSNFFSITKDTYSDNYALVYKQYIEGDKTIRYEVFHYNSNHKEISHVTCASPDPSNRMFLHFYDIVVVGDESVNAFFCIAKDKYSLSSKKGYAVMAKIQKGASTVNYTTIAAPTDIMFSSSVVKYNPLTNKMYFLVLESNEKERYRYNVHLNIIDQATLKMQTITNINAADEKTNSAYKDQFDKKRDYMGLPQDININDNGSFSIMYEENTHYSESGYTVSWLGKVLYTNYDKNGNALSGYILPKVHRMNKISLSSFYVSSREGRAQWLYYGYQYKSFIYLDGTKDKYILFNDTERNNEIKKDKIVEVQSIADCDGFIYKLTGNDLQPKRDYAFGENKNGHSIALFLVSDYNKKNNVYVTLRLDKETRTSKEVKLVWLQPQ